MWLNLQLHECRKARGYDAKVKVWSVYCAILDALQGVQGVHSPSKSKSEQRLQSLKARFGYVRDKKTCIVHRPVRPLWLIKKICAVPDHSAGYGPSYGAIGSASSSSIPIGAMEVGYVHDDYGSKSEEEVGGMTHCKPIS